MEGENVEVLEYDKAYEKYMNIIPTLEKNKGWITEHLVKYQGIWLTPKGGLKGVIMSQQLFKSKPNDIFLATFPKSGTTWFKAIIFSIINRKLFSPNEHPLLNSSPHECVPFLELLYSNKENLNSTLEHLQSPRIFATHSPYPLFSQLLGSNLTTSPTVKIVYVARNPKDVLISTWEFTKKLRHEANLPLISLQEAYDMFCQGLIHFGSYWDHVLGYYKASLMYPKNVLFLSYETMKDDPSFWVRNLADFLDQGFTKEEEGEGLVKKILDLCSFESLSKVGANKSGIQRFTSHVMVPSSYFFRKGVVGDWRKYLTMEMAQHLDEITKCKFESSGLSCFRSS